jgi:arsenite oxidase small subunit
LNRKAVNSLSAPAGIAIAEYESSYPIFREANKTMEEDRMSSLSRRSFIKLGGSTAAATAVAITPGQAQAASNTQRAGATVLPYPITNLGKASKLSVNKAVSFNYPDESSPCALIKMGKPVPGGVGPDKDIVAYSTMCTHMGCPVTYDPSTRDFKCPCHYSVFDSEKEGQMVTGQATENLPSILLAYDNRDGSVSAIGVDGLIYGRQSNIL